MPKRRAITLFDAPSAMAASTSSSRGVSTILASVSTASGSPASIEVGSSSVPSTSKGTTASPLSAAAIAPVISVLSAERGRTAAAPACSASSVPSTAASPTSATTGVPGFLICHSLNSSRGSLSASSTSMCDCSRSCASACTSPTMPATTMPGVARSSRSSRSRSFVSVQQIAIAAIAPVSTPPAVTIASVSSERALADDDLEIGRRASAQQLQIDAGADAVGSEQPHDLAHLHDRLAVPRGDDVADHEGGAGGGSLRIDADHQNPAPRVGRILRPASEPDVLQAGAEIAAGDVALAEQLVDRAVDGRARDRQHPPARPEHGHAEHTPIHIDQRAAFGEPVERKVEAQQAVDGAAAPALPGGADIADDAEARDRRALVAADRQREVAGAQRRCCNLRRRQPIRLEAQHGDVGRRIAARQRGSDLTPAGQR